MNEERLKILQMLQDGKITVEEASRLIAVTECPEVAANPVLASTGALANVTPRVEVVNVPPVDEPYREFRLRDLLPLKFVFGVSMDRTLTEGANFEGAKVLFSSLEGANLRHAKLHGAWLVGVSLEGANFEGADLRGAVLAGASFEHADFRGADLRDTVLAAASFENADFRGANLRGRRLIGVSMEGHKHSITPVEAVPEV